MSSHVLCGCLKLLELATVLFTYVFGTVTLYIWLSWRREGGGGSESLYYSLLWFLSIVLVIVQVGVLLQMDLFLCRGQEQDQQRPGVLLISGRYSTCHYF